MVNERPEDFTNPMILELLSTDVLQAAREAARIGGQAGMLAALSKSEAETCARYLRQGAFQALQAAKRLATHAAEKA